MKSQQVRTLATQSCDLTMIPWEFTQELSRESPSGVFQSTISNAIQTATTHLAETVIIAAPFQGGNV